MEDLPKADATGDWSFQDEISHWRQLVSRIGLAPSLEERGKGPWRLAVRHFPDRASLFILYLGLAVVVWEEIFTVSS